MAGASALSATAGATAGAVSARAAEQQRLQRIVDAVARQEPRISWAAGLRDDGTTTLLVTDLAGGWIPPHVRLPANVTLLEPTARRRDADVIDLLGAVVAVAAHESNTYVAEPGPDAPALTGDRSARSAIPKVDEFGPGTSTNIHDLVAQACAFINYARGHYGVAADASNLADLIQQADPRRSPRGY